MKKRSIFTLFLLTIGCCFVIGGASSIYGQEDAGDEFTLEEITVTAEKRTENIQKIPMSVEVITGETITNQGATTIEDILKNVAGISTPQMGTVGYTVYIRGMGQDLPTGVGEPSVSTNFDGAYQMRSEAGLSGFFDVERVEVLRGPQGTLYGRNASGGVVNISSVKPTADKVSGYASLEAGNYNKLSSQAAVNVPVSDKFAGRLAFISTKQSAYTHDDHGNAQDQQNLATRLQLRYIPSDEAYINLLTSYNKMTGSGFAQVSAENWAAGKYDVNNETYPYNLTKRSSNITKKISMTAEFPAGPGIVTFLPSYENMKGRESSYSLPMGFPGMPPTSDEPTFNESGRPYNNVTKTAELRYANKSDSRVKWLAGLWWTKTDEPKDPKATSGPRVDKWFETSSIFSQVSYPFSETMRMVLGGRYTKDQKGYFNGTDDYIKAKNPLKNSFDFNYFDWKAGIENDFGTNIMGYFTLSTGHRSGGYNEMDGKPFGTESNMSGELGLKSRLMNNRLQVNGDIYYYDYKDYQATQTYEIDVDKDGVIDSDEIFSEYKGVDKTVNYGAEFDITALVGSATQFNFSLAYLKTEYKSDYFISDFFSGGPILNMKGESLARSPEFSINAGVEHEFYFSNGSSLRPSASFRWTDDQYSNVPANENNFVPSNGLLDLGLNYNSGKGWTLNAYANNALNKHYYNMMFFGGYSPGNPRTMGITLNVKF